MDFSHKINNLQIGTSISRLTRLSKKYKDIINPTSLKKEEFIAKDQKEGHSRFLYELNIVTAKIGRYSLHFLTNYSLRLPSLKKII
jgi:hypothetical protein